MKFHQVRIGVESNNFPVTRSEITACPTSVVPKTPLTKLIIIYMQLEKKMQELCELATRSGAENIGHYDHEHPSGCHHHRSSSVSMS